MEHQERREFWLAWNLLPFLGGGAAAAARKMVPSNPARAAARTGEVPRGILPELIRRLRQVELDAAIRNEWEEAERFGCRILTLADGGYPRLLREIPDPPPILYLLGELRPEDERSVAVVGARRATRYGLQSARWIAGDLARIGLTVVSGLARGIDTEAHRAALEAGGRTIGILGSGIARPYPPENRELCGAIARSGAVLSPFPLRTEPFPRNFPERNRVLSGLSLGTLVVEAAERSGSLITARLALEQDREVFAIPGRITGRESVGANYLIKSGAKLVQSAADVVEEFPPEVRDALRPVAVDAGGEEKESLSPQERRILDALSVEEAVHIDRLAERVPIGTPLLLENLLSLEMRQRVVHLPGQHYILRV